MPMLIALAAAVAGIPEHWKISDSTDNFSGERRIYAEVAALEEASNPADYRVASFQMACPLSGETAPTMWMTTDHRFDLKELATHFIPKFGPGDDVVKVFPTGAFVFSHSGDGSIHPANDEALDAFLTRFAENGPMTIQLFYSGNGQANISVSLKGYKAVRSYLTANCRRAENKQ